MNKIHSIIVSKCLKKQQSVGKLILLQMYVRRTWHGCWQTKNLPTTFQYTIYYENQCVTTAFYYFQLKWEYIFIFIYIKVKVTAACFLQQKENNIKDFFSDKINRKFNIFWFIKRKIRCSLKKRNNQMLLQITTLVH